MDDDKEPKKLDEIDLVKFQNLVLKGELLVNEREKMYERWRTKYDLKGPFSANMHDGLIKEE